MKLLSFTILSVISFSAYSVYFQSCTDANGRKHFTNLPESSLDSNCAVKDHYALMLNQDYQNLSSEYKKFENIEQVNEINEIKEEFQNSEQTVVRKDSKPFDLRVDDFSVESVKE